MLSDEHRVEPFTGDAAAAGDNRRSDARRRPQAQQVAYCGGATAFADSFDRDDALGEANDARCGGTDHGQRSETRWATLQRRLPREVEPDQWSPP